jgi:hypothetical protein
MLLFGWTPKQFGNAKLYYERITGDSPAPTYQGAAKVRSVWTSRRADIPLQTEFADVKQESDIDWAMQTFISTAHTSLCW